MSELPQPVVFVSLVGQRPGAIAVALKSLIGARGVPGAVVLGATPQTRSAARRLKTYCEAQGIDRGAVSIVDLRADLPGPDDVEDFIARIRATITGRRGRIVLDGDPGPKWLIVQLVRELGPETVTLHVEKGFLYVIDGSRATPVELPLEPVGVQALLDLHGLRSRPGEGGRLEGILRRLATRTGIDLSLGITIETQFGDELALDAVYERDGWLRGLCSVRKLQELRVALAWAAELRALTPELAFLVHADAEKPAVLRAHVRELGHVVVDADERSLAGWLNTATDRNRAAPRAAGELPLPVLGRGGAGGDLLVFLGPDPTPTVTSIQTHQPDRAWVCCDVEHPRVVELAHRLARYGDQLDCGVVHFAPTDWAGAGVVDVPRVTVGDSLRVDATAGKKSQGVAASRLPGAQIWSLHPGRREALRLDGSGESIPLRGASLWLYARMHGGELHASGNEITDIGRLSSAEREWWRGLAKALSRTPRHGEGLTLKDRVEGYARSNRPPFDTRAVGLHDGGKWLDRLAGVCLYDAGADEVLVNVAWAWEDRKLGRLGHREELDVVARFGERIYVCSCKLVRLAVSDPKLEQDECAAVASTRVARFAIPVVVRPTFGSSARKRELKARGVTRRLQFGTLVDSTTLAQQLDHFARSRSTYVRSDGSESGGSSAQPRQSKGRPKDRRRSRGQEQRPQGRGNSPA